MSSDANLVYKEKHANRKPSPLVGEGVNRQVDGRGKCEQKQKNENKCEQNAKMILNCIRQLAPIASQARYFPPRSGEAYIKEKRIYIFI